MSNLAQTTVRQQVAMPAFQTVAYAWGEEDAMKGEGESNGYNYFAGASLEDYFAGYAAGRAMLDSLKAKVLDEVRRTLQGDPTLAAWDADGQPVSGATWSGDYGDVVGAEDRSEWIGA